MMAGVWQRAVSSSALRGHLRPSSQALPVPLTTYLPAAWLLSAALRVGCATVRLGHACLTGMGKEDQPKGCANCQVIEMGAGDVMA